MYRRILSPRSFLNIPVLGLVFAVAGIAQSQPEVLTNAKIIDMVRQGWSEKFIVEKINHSVCQCDTSSDALPKLQAAKVSEDIIMAMMNATASYSESGPAIKASKEKEEKDNDPPVTKTSSTTVSSSVEAKALKQIGEPGIYLFEDGKMTGIEPTVFSGTKMNPFKSIMTGGLMKVKIKAKIRGRSSNLHTPMATPVFYFVFNPEFRNSGATMAGLWGVATSPAEFMLVQLDIQQNSRQAVIGEAGGFTGTVSTGARDKDVREYSFEKIRTGVYKVVPKVNLTSGEYAFYYAAEIAGVFGGGKVFDFGVGK